MKLFSIKAVALFLLIFNFTINYFILNSSYEYFFQIPINSRLLFILFFAVLFFLVNYFFMISSTIKEINWFMFIFLFFSLSLTAQERSTKCTKVTVEKLDHARVKVVEHNKCTNVYTVRTYLILEWEKIQAEKKAINDILLPEWKSLLSQLL